MMQPKRTKFRKRHKGRNDGITKGGATLNFGAFGMKATTNARVTARQIEAARRAITRHLKRAGRVWIRIFPDQPVSKKPAEVRMGKGKGSVEYWVAPVKAGSLTVKGKVQGSVVAQGIVIVSKTGSVRGDIEAPSIQIEQGAVIDAFLRIGPNSHPADK